MEITPCDVRMPRCEEDVLENDVLCVPHKILTIETMVVKNIIAKKLKTKWRKCTINDCSNRAYFKGKLCVSHSGKRKCAREGCNKTRQGNAFCLSHGGSHSNTKCKTDGCTKFNQGGGHCYKHGGCKRCVVAECTSRVKSSKCNVCDFHLRKVNTKDLLDKLIPSSGTT